VEILDDGTLTGIENVDQLRAWQLDGLSAPFHDGPVATAVVPQWNASSPGPLVLDASKQGIPGWLLGIASISTDGHLGDVVADRVVGWTL
jgi:hypothetical protein